MSSQLPFRGLPTELLEIIVPDPQSNIALIIPIYGRSKQLWLPIKSTYEHIPFEWFQEEVKDTIATLWTLAQTSRTFRELALPRLWALVHVHSVEELGRLREVLRVSPEIARHIRSFSFVWTILDDCDGWPAELGATLDLAFRDRRKVWNFLRKQHKQPIKWDPISESPAFFHAGGRYAAPGKYSWPSSAEGAKPDWSAVLRAGVGGCGPDGKGQDKLLTSALQFNECVNEIVGRLSKLEAFGWNSNVAQLPNGAFDSLRKLDSLTSLGYGYLCRGRECLHALPLWELASRLQDLTLDSFWPEVHSMGERDEEEVASWELPEHLPEDDDEVEELQEAVASRTIVAAARGGQLKSLSAGNENDVEPPFAIRSLLPVWVSIEHWHRVLGSFDDWLVAAATLRRLLAHASLWINKEPGGMIARPDRHLALQEVQSLNAHYAGENMPNLAAIPDDDDEIGHPLERAYLPWLEEDAQLAQQVADAWNVIVQEGKANVQECGCGRCREYRGEPESDEEYASGSSTDWESTDGEGS